MLMKSQIKSLGIYFDPSLRFERHVEHVGGKVSKSSYLLRAIRALSAALPRSIPLQTCHAVFQSFGPTNLYFFIPSKRF